MSRARKKKPPAKKKATRPATWMPAAPKEAEGELRTLLAAMPEAMTALERAWRLAITIAPTSIALAYSPDEPPVKAPTMDITDRQLVRDLLGSNVMLDDAVLAEVGTVIENTGLLLLGKRPDDDYRSPAETVAYLTSLLVPYLYVCCEVVLGVPAVNSRQWALSEFAFNRGTPQPTSVESWQRAIQSWRKHYMTGGVEGRKNKNGVVVPHMNNITVAGIRSRLEAGLRRRRQGS